MTSDNRVLSEYRDGIDPPDFDSAITQVVESFKPFAGGEPCVLAIEDSSGAVYRVLTVHGLADWNGMANKLGKLGFVDRYVDSEEPIDGYDSRFARQ